MIFQSDYSYDYSSFFGTFIGLAINIGIAILIYNDAKKRGMEPTGYVILTCLCGCCLGGIVYLIAMSSHPIQTESQQPAISINQTTMYGQQPQTMYGQPQPQHQQSQRQPTKITPDTTTMPSVDSIFCPVCGSTNQKNAKYCSHCGAELN
ncbi:MAG: zinc ribbon domain-containing protein [Promethearchaeota archaeon]